MNKAEAMRHARWLAAGWVAGLVEACEAERACPRCDGVRGDDCADCERIEAALLRVAKMLERPEEVRSE